MGRTLGRLNPAKLKTLPPLAVPIPATGHERGHLCRTQYVARREIRVWHQPHPFARTRGRAMKEDKT